mmetsp:Transcript_25661/g.60742  ORF Transcript_25661/g.60742 Transcript_25661/m.60742 type:complete len:88 (+) Transcript_25661:1079-1342(+)
MTPPPATLSVSNRLDQHHLGRHYPHLPSRCHPRRYRRHRRRYRPQQQQQQRTDFVGIDPSIRLINLVSITSTVNNQRAKALYRIFLQ